MAPTKTATAEGQTLRQQLESAYTGITVTPGSSFFQHFTKRLRERAPWVADPDTTAEQTAAAVLGVPGYEARAAFVAKARDPSIEYWRVFDEDGTPLGFAVVSCKPGKRPWLATFYDQGMFRRKRANDLKARKGKPVSRKLTLDGLRRPEIR